MPDPTNASLGEALADTYGCSFFNTPALIRAFRDWLLPEEPEPDDINSEDWHVWDERRDLRTLLTEQARIAENDPSA
jgi:hypothetical protein